MASFPLINWAEVLPRHDRWLRTVVAARLGERQAVDEVLQEVGLTAVSSPAPGDPAAVAGWLYRVAVRKALQYRRSMGRRRKHTGRYADRLRTTHPTEPGSSPSPDPLGWLLSIERMTLIRAAIGRLPPRDAEILLLKYNENWSCRDLADHLGQTEAAIESRLHRARQKLRQALTASQVIEREP